VIAPLPRRASGSLGVLVESLVGLGAVRGLFLKQGRGFSLELSERRHSGCSVLGEGGQLGVYLCVVRSLR